MSTLSQRDIVEAMAYEQINPGSEWRQDWRIAQLQATLCNIFGDSKGKQWSAKDFMPKFDKLDIDQQKLEATERIKRIFGVLAVKKGR